MLKFIITISIIATLAASAFARISATTNYDFRSQAEELVEGSYGEDCERGLGATKFCGEDEFCALDRFRACQLVNRRLLTGKCRLAGPYTTCYAKWDSVWLDSIDILLVTIHFMTDT
jgi:hypothetical protein